MYDLMSKLLATVLVFNLGQMVVAANPKSNSKPSNQTLAIKKDPVERCFLLPNAIHLRSDQQTALDALKNKYRIDLKSALNNKDSATTDTEKEAAVREFLKLKQTIRQEMIKILHSPDPNPKTPNTPKPPVVKRR